MVFLKTILKKKGKEYEYSLIKGNSTRLALKDLRYGLRIKHRCWDCNQRLRSKGKQDCKCLYRVHNNPDLYVVISLYSVKKAEVQIHGQIGFARVCFNLQANCFSIRKQNIYYYDTVHSAKGNGITIYVYIRYCIYLYF